jgi:hypothetical protein
MKNSQPLDFKQIIGGSGFRCKPEVGQELILRSFNLERSATGSPLKMASNPPPFLLAINNATSTV